MVNAVALVIQGFNTLGMTVQGFAKVSPHTNNKHVHVTSSNHPSDNNSHACKMPGRVVMPNGLANIVMSKSFSRSSVCSRCGIWTDTGRISCCAPGGSWHGMCGSLSNGFKYTWTEGLNACKGGNGGALMQAQAFGFGNLTQDFGVAQQQQKRVNPAAFNRRLHGITILILGLAL